MIVFVTNRPGRVGVNAVLIDVIKYPVFLLKASLSLFLVSHETQNNVHGTISAKEVVVDKTNILNC